ncbi:thiol peroxidase [Anaerolentibacter hominis]|uniref:thiol peroxidase n=1 Tax=Anaerolentibacter hominis TaxID=3079009 RepID=UPI0031B85513
MNITFKGNPVTLRGTVLKEGDKMPDTILYDNQLNPVHAKDLPGIKVFVVVPSLDTGVCDMEVKKFNEKAASLPGVSIYGISLDLPFAQSRWCASNGIEHVRTLSDYYNRDFGYTTGTFIEQLALLTRAVFIVDDTSKILLAQYVPEVTDHPDYDTIYAKLEELAG